MTTTVEALRSRGLRATDVDPAASTAACLQASGTTAAGFSVDETEVTYWGLCPPCQQGTAGG